MSNAEHFMQLALDLARQGEGRTCPNPPVGALVAVDGMIVGRGHHPRAGQPHAEIFALEQAGAAAHGATLYVTLEPCAHQGRTGPCTRAIIAAGIARVVVGTRDPNPLVAGRGIAQLRNAGIAVVEDVLVEECRRLIAPFARHITTGLPFVTLKAATTLDGKTATAVGESQWISNEASRADVHQLRNCVDGIMVGVGTVLRDNPRLTTRLVGESRDPVRVVVDSRLRTPLEAKVLQQDSPAPTLIATTPQASRDQIRALEECGAQVLVCNEIEGQGVDLLDLMRQLGAYPLQHLLVEGGALLNHSLLMAGLVDRIRFYLAPMLLGGSDAKGIFSGHGIPHLPGAVRLTGLRSRMLEGDILIEGEVERCLPG